MAYRSHNNDAVLLNASGIHQLEDDKRQFIAYYTAICVARFNFDIEGLQNLLDQYVKLPNYREDMVIVHRLFARLFGGDLVTDAEIEPWTQFSVHPRWRSILLQGMYLSPTGAYGSLMIELGRSILNHSGEAWNRDPNTMM